jgi:hypothetical protein
MILGFELRVSWLLGALPLQPHHEPLCVLGIFEIESLELFAWAAFEPPSS